MSVNLFEILKIIRLRFDLCKFLCKGRKKGQNVTFSKDRYKSQS